MLSLTLSGTTKADCVSQCTQIIKTAQKALADKDQQISDLDKHIQDLNTELNTVTADRDADLKSKDAWYHNAFILIPIGLLVGGGYVLYLDRR